MSHEDYRVPSATTDTAAFFATLPTPPILPPVSDPFRSGRLPRATTLRGHVAPLPPIVSAQLLANVTDIDHDDDPIFAADTQPATNHTAPLAATLPSDPIALTSPVEIAPVASRCVPMHNRVCR
ncbi:Aste57867_15079 [Aphanomyces stellatus]|uniref:Aste57867_15079 protein n=1 Tax=Aphanomyces stellatus TaxID=120398 RepID=A0A485L2C4_9STRA|nr:hypothetical protein As57867_015023 [Aphanomyces stellatus]VFT91892.1 Aste57867_15079 [Aphanomyces stellatus]